MSFLPTAKGVSISATAAQTLLRLGNGDAALLYIWILQNSGRFSPADAAAALSRTQAEIESAVAALAAAGLLTASAPPMNECADETREYTAADIKNELQNGSDFRILVDEAQALLGKVLSSGDLIKFFGIYNDLHLPSEVLLQLIGYCAEECRRRYGSGRVPTMRYIEKTAFAWEREGIFSIDDAEAYLKRVSRLRSATGEIKSALGIYDRDLTQTERKYVESWLDMGFNADAVEIALDRTAIKTGKLSWGYMDSIMRSWHEKGLHTAAEIEKGDKRRAKKTPEATDTQTAPNAADIERMRRMLRKIDEQED